MQHRPMAQWAHQPVGLPGRDQPRKHKDPHADQSVDAPDLFMRQPHLHSAHAEPQHRKERQHKQERRQHRTPWPREMAGATYALQGNL